MTYFIGILVLFLVMFVATQFWCFNDRIRVLEESRKVQVDLNNKFEDLIQRNFELTVDINAQLQEVASANENMVPRTHSIPDPFDLIKKRPRNDPEMPLL